MLFMLKETCIMHGIYERMRGGEAMQGRRRAYQYISFLPVLKIRSLKDFM